MAAVDRLGVPFLSQEVRIAALFFEPGARTNLVEPELFLREARVEEDIGREREHLIELIRQCRTGERRNLRALTRRDRDACRHRVERLGDLLGRFGRGALVHQRRRGVGEPWHVRRIVVAACANHDDLELNRRHAMVFEHHQMRAVRELDLLRARQRDLEDLVADRRFVLEFGRGWSEARPAPAPAQAARSW